MPSALRAALLPLPLVLLVAKAAGWFSRVLRRGRGTSVPGVIARRIDPTLLSRLVAGLRDGVVVVTGTNGKTSTCHLLRAALAESPVHVVANTAGSNLEQGVLTALIRDRDLWGRPTGTLAVLEVDEAAFGRLATQLSPRLVVVLNLFRDQLDRHAELDQVASTIGSALASVDCTVLLNADDARVAALSSRARGPVAFFGLDRPVDDRNAAPAGDISPCPACGGQLSYGWVSYAQLGRYACPSCGLQRPTPTVAVTGAQPLPAAGWRVWVRSGASHLVAETSLRGAYNVYNVVAAVAAAQRLGVSGQDALDAAAGSSPVPGRGARTTVGDGEIVILLGKNPTSVAQVMDAYICAEPTAPLLVVLNDAAADGRDVSWIWDAPLEDLAGRPGPVLVAGTRSDSMLMRLEYAEVAARGCDTVEDALDQLMALVRHGGRGFVMTTYSAVQPLDDRLARLRDRPVEVGSAA